MFEKTEAAINGLAQAVADDVNTSVAGLRAMAVPAVAGVFTKMASAAMMAKARVEAESFLRPKPKAAAPSEPTKSAINMPQEKQDAILAVIKASPGASDEAIAALVNVDPAVVKLFR